MMKLAAFLTGCLLVLAAGPSVVGQLQQAEPLTSGGNPMLKKLTEDVVRARDLIDTNYYQQVPAPLERGVRLNEQNQLECYEYRSLAPLERSYHQGPQGQLILNYERPVRTVQQKREALRLYEEVDRQLKVLQEQGERADAPIEFLGVSYPVVAKMIPAEHDAILRLFAAYAQKPSNLRSVVRLELALLMADLGDETGYRRSLDDALRELKLPEMDYRSDTGLRLRLLESLNFARPEVCLLFLAAEDARLGKRAEEAIRRYSTLVERAPGSPFAWEALARLSVMPEADPKEIGRLTDVLLETYPLIWGCARPGLKLTKEEFAAQLPALLKKVGQEKWARRR